MFHTSFLISLLMFKLSLFKVFTDNEIEIVQSFCSDLFLSKGLIHQRIIPDNPQQNGRVERKHMHLFETSRALRIHANLPIKFWDECLLTATYIINCMPSYVLNWKSTYEILMKKSPDYTSFRVVGCLCYFAKKMYIQVCSQSNKMHLLGLPLC